MTRVKKMASHTVKFFSSPGRSTTPVFSDHIYTAAKFRPHHPQMARQIQVVYEKPVFDQHLAVFQK